MEGQVDSLNSDHHLPSTSRLSSSPSPSKQWWENFAPHLRSSFLPPSSYQENPPPSVSPRVEDTCDQKASNVATASKGLHACCTAGCWHLLPLPLYHPLLCFILKAPLAPPRSLKETHCPCFLSCLRLPELGKQYSTKERERELPVLLCVMQDKGAVYCTPLRGSCFYTHGALFDEEKRNPLTLLCRSTQDSSYNSNIQ